LRIAASSGKRVPSEASPAPCPGLAPSADREKKENTIVGTQCSSSSPSCDDDLRLRSGRALAPALARRGRHAADEAMPATDAETAAAGGADDETADLAELEAEDAVRESGLAAIYCAQYMWRAEREMNISELARERCCKCVREHRRAIACVPCSGEKNAKRTVGEARIFVLHSFR
jgi:hypothetical protein